MILLHDIPKEERPIPTSCLEAIYGLYHGYNSYTVFMVNSAHELVWTWENDHWTIVHDRVSYYWQRRHQNQTFANTPPTHLTILHTLETDREELPPYEE